jgi:Alpha/beta hydrolase domain
MALRLRLALTTAVVALVPLAACSSSSHSSSPPSVGGSTTIASTARPAPTGPAATLSGPVTGGKGLSLISTTPLDLNAAHYKEAEFFAAGTAQSYSAVGAQGADGMWSVKPTASASYKTRIVVRAPSDPSKFSGNVLVEWMNVSGGVEIPPDFGFTSTQILRSGDAWVGVSAQKLAIDGGTGVVQATATPSGGLRGGDPARYGSLRHPGDQYALDIFSQVGRALRTPGAVDALGGLKPQRIIAIGESQSAFELTTYIDALQPVTHVFDGFFVHSRGGGAMPLAGGNIGGGLSGGVHIRTDIDVPVLMLETETDEAFLGYFNARQPDTDHIRLWDVAGGSHADAFLVGGSASALGCKGLINEAPTHYVVSAALSALDKWVQSGTPPPSAPRMDVKLENGKPVVQRDAHGIAIGGIRTAAITVPVAAYSGVATPGSSTLCALFGSTKPFDAATIASLYKNKSDYSTKFARATGEDVQAGYILIADREGAIANGVKMYP